MSRRFLLLFLAVALLRCPSCFAQGDAATISGWVRDQSGAVIVGAKVQISNLATGLTFSTLTNNEGLYAADLHPGPYRIRVEQQGFRTIVLTDLTLNVQDALTRNFKMVLGAASESITVTAGEYNVSPAVSTLVDSKFVENVPLNGQSFQSLIQLAPGVVITPTTGGPGQFSVNGQRTDTNYFMVDGVSANFSAQTSGTSTAFSGSVPALTSGGGTNGLVSVDAMQEFRIETSSYAPEFGRSPGAQISIVTKSGTNQWHGTAFDYLRNDIFDSRNYFDAPPLPKPPLRMNDFGGTVGGPIWKDHTFFFFSYEGLRLRQPQTSEGYYFSADAKAAVTGPWKPIIEATPTGTGALADPTCNDVTIPCERELTASYSNPTSFDAYSLRVDQKITNTITFFARYVHAPSANGINYLNFEQLTAANSDAVTAGVTAAISSTLVNDFRANWSQQTGPFYYTFQSAYGAIAPPKSTIIPSGFSPADSNVAYIFAEVPAGNVSLSEGLYANAIQRQLNFVNTVSKNTGSHQLKFGVDLRRLKPTTVGSSSLVMVSLTWKSLLAGTVDEVVNDTDDTITAHIFNWSLFAQDTWKTTPRLTLTYGLRWEINTPPVSDTSGKPLYALNGIFNSLPLGLAPAGTPLWHPQWDAFAPRFGAAFQINPATVLRGGFGLFYDLGYGSDVDDFLGYSFPYDRETISLNVPLNLSLPAYQSIPFSTQITSKAFGLTAVDPNLRLPVTYQWNFALERALGSQQSISATYVGAHGSDLLYGDYIVPPGSIVAAAGSNVLAQRNAGASNYNALQLQFMRRMSQGLQALISYTYAHSYDMDSSDSEGNTFPSVAAATLPPMTPSDFDRRQQFSAALSYDLPKSEWGGRIGKAALNGWGLDGIYRYQSALPLDVMMGEFSPTLGEINVRPARVPGQPIWIPDPTQPNGKALNPAAFTLPPNGSSDDALRNSIQSPYPISQMDTGLRRQFNLTERAKLNFRVQYFNVLNHPMFGGPLAPDTYWGQCTGTTPASCVGGENTLFGKVIPGETLNVGLGGGRGGLDNAGQSPLFAVGGPRSAQFSLKLTF